MIDHAKLKRESGNEYSRTMRVHYLIYDEIKRLKAVFAERQGRRSTSFNDFLYHCCFIGELILTGQELYEANGKLFPDIESARGEAILESRRSRKAAKPPTVLLKLGTDNLLGRPDEA